MGKDIMTFDNVTTLHSNVSGDVLAAFGLNTSTHDKAALASLGATIANAMGYSNPNFGTSAKGPTL